MGNVTNAVDISLYQDITNYTTLLNELGEDALVMVKFGQGSSPTLSTPFVDPKMAGHLAGLSKATPTDNFYIGAYWYYTAKTRDDVIKEASFYIDLLKRHKDKLNGWAAVDLEDQRCLEASMADRNDYIKLFCDLIKAAGFKPIIYTNLNWIRYNITLPTEYPLWLAYWVKNPTPRRFVELMKEREPLNLKMWQYGSRTIAGVNGPIDSNFAIDVIGDANADNCVNARDIVSIMKYMLANSNEVDFSQADVDKNNKVNARDIIEIMKRILE